VSGTVQETEMCCIRILVPPRATEFSRPWCRKGIIGGRGNRHLLTDGGGDRKDLYLMQKWRFVSSGPPASVCRLTFR